MLRPRALAFGALSLLLLPAVYAAVVSEDFENDTPPAAPAESWYTFTSSGSGEFRTSSAENLAGSNVNYFQNSSSGTGIFSIVVAEVPDYEVCQLVTANGSPNTPGNPPTIFNFSFRIDGALDDTFQKFGLVHPTTEHGFFLGFNLTEFHLEITGDDMSGVDTYITDTSAAIGGLVPSVGLWYNVTWTFHNCDVGGNTLADPDNCSSTGAATNTIDERHQIYFKDQDKGITQTSTAVRCFRAADGVSSASDLTRFQFAQSDAFDLRFDNWDITTISAPVAITATATATLSTIVDFHVDKSGGFAIARNATGAASSDQINTYGAQSLGTALATASSDCTEDFTNGGVFASTVSLVAYLDCTDSDPDFLRIRTGSLGTPTFPGVCGEGATEVNFCPFDIQLTLGSSNFVDNDDFIQLQDMALYPIDFSGDQSPGGAFNPSEAYIAFSYVTRTGRLGVAAYTAEDESLGDRRNQAAVQFSSSVVNDFCSWVDDGEPLVAAVDNGVTAKVFPVDFTFVTDGSVRELRVALSDPPIPIPTSTGVNTGIDCAEDKVAISSTSGFGVYNRTTGASVFAEQFDTSDPNGIALSGDARFGAVVALDTGVITVFNATNPTFEILATVNSDTSDTIEIYMDQAGGKLWHATTDTINFFQVSNVTCTVNCGFGGESSIPTPDTTVAPAAPLFDTEGIVESGLVTSTFGANLFLGAIVMFGGAISGVGAMSFSRNGMVMGIGALFGIIMGVLMAWAFGLLTTGTVFAIVVFLIVALVSMFFLRRGGGGG